MSESRLVYSTDGGRPRDLRDTPEPPRGPSGRSRHTPARPPAAVPDDGIVRLFREKGARAGKVVTVIRGLPERGPALDKLAGELKKFCGAGGAVKERVIEVQGDHRERLADRLRALGYTVKVAGG